MLGDSVTTDHISPAGAIKPESPAGKYLIEHGVERKSFNSYGSRRGNHEVMVRGTFANVRLRNLLVPGSEGTWTVHLPSGEETSIYDASVRYLAEGTPLIVIAGKEYGSGSSRDWAAKGPKLLGVQAVIAESYERIHRSNLLMMGILPLQFRDGETPETLGLSGPRGVRDRGGRERRGPRGDGPRRRQDFTAASGSTRPASATTCATAGSSRSCSAACSPPSLLLALLRHRFVVRDPLGELRITPRPGPRRATRVAAQSSSRLSSIVLSSCRRGE